MPLTSKGTPYVVSTDLVANYPTVSSDLADHIDDNLQYNAQAINAQTGSGANAYTFVLADASLYKLVTASNAAAATYTVPPQSSVTWADGAVLRILNQGAGVVTLAGGSGVTLNGSILTLSQFQYAEIHRTASNTWTVIGISTQPGLVLVNPTSIANSGGSASSSDGTTTFTGVSSISLNGVFSATYANYKVLMEFSGSSGATSVSLRFRNGGNNDTTASYNLRGYENTANTIAQISQIDQTSLNLLPDTATVGNMCSLEVIDPFASRITQGWFQSHIGHAGVEDKGYNATISLLTTTSQDGVSIFPGTGTITGSIRVYGYRGA